MSSPIFPGARESSFLCEEIEGGIHYRRSQNLFGVVLRITGARVVVIVKLGQGLVDRQLHNEGVHSLEKWVGGTVVGIAEVDLTTQVQCVKSISIVLILSDKNLAKLQKVSIRKLTSTATSTFIIIVRTAIAIFRTLVIAFAR